MNIKWICHSVFILSYDLTIYIKLWYNRYERFERLQKTENDEKKQYEKVLDEEAPKENDKPKYLNYLLLI